MSKCASCNGKVDDGAVRCVLCGANLALPGAFLQTLGFVVIAISTVPFALSEVVSREGNQVPIIAGVVVLAIGAGMVFSARARNRLAPKTVIEDEATSGAE